MFYVTKDMEDVGSSAEPTMFAKGSEALPRTGRLDSYHHLQARNDSTLWIGMNESKRAPATLDPITMARCPLKRQDLHTDFLICHVNTGDM